VADGAPLTSHDRPDDNVLVFNLLVDNATHYRMTRRTPTALGATNTVFAFNVLAGGDVASRIDGPNPGAVWHGNRLWQVKADGDFPAGGRQAGDPGLVRSDGGLPRLPAESAFAQAAAAAYPFVRDMDPAQVRLLAPEDVGPRSP
jgi:poly(beta-D-mannuronate) lyase